MFSHDQAFKNLILEYVLSALQFLFPEVTASWPDDVVVEPIRQEQLKQRMGDSFRELDIPVQIKFPGGSRETMIVVIETESRDRADFLKYLAIVSIHISIQMKTDRVVPAVVYPFRKKPFVERFSLSDDSRTFLDFSCVSCVLSKMEALKFERSRNIVARLCLPLMAHEPADKLRLILRAYEGLIELEPDYGKQVKYAEFLAYYSALEKEEIQEFREAYIEKSPFRENMMTLASIWKEEGIEEGKALGKAEGKAEGAIMSILAMFESKTISADDARAQLKLFAEQGVAPRAMVAKALRRITK